MSTKQYSGINITTFAAMISPASRLSSAVVAFTVSHDQYTAGDATITVTVSRSRKTIILI
uniref:IncF plasmid conjugative transfer protein TrbE n=1 Tax=Salmonella pullorum TaxID=605 RepID=H9ACC9_SALPU|nr:IncF plasmid conjugative transfer protein TrbE [Salmonella enterica subsp. enterica serovar Pullorum]